MIFEGLTPQATSADPELFRFRVRLRMAYIVRNVTEFNMQMSDAMTRFGQSMVKAAESLRLVLPYFKEPYGA